MFDAKKLLGGLMRGNMGGGKGFGARAGIGLGVLGVAMEAVNHYMKQSGEASATGVTPPPPPPPGGPPLRAELSTPGTVAPPPPPPGGPPPAASPEPGSEEAVLLIRAMIASAAADGEIDANERETIMGKLESADLSPEERRFIEDELDHPADLETIVQSVASPETARHVYAVSLLAIDLDTDAERHYLKGLASRLKLDAAEQDRIHEKLNAPKL